MAAQQADQRGGTVSTDPRPSFFGDPVRWRRQRPLLTWGVPRPDAANSLRCDPSDEPGRRIGHVWEHDVGPEVRVRETLEDFGGTTLRHLRSPIHDEVLEQTPLVLHSRRHGKRNTRVAAEVPQLALIRQRRENDLVPLNPDPS